MHPTSARHSSAPQNPASWLAFLRLPRQVPLELSDVHESRGGKCLLNSLGYTTYGNKGWLINFLYFVGPSWILNIWDVWVHTFKVHRARHVEPGSIFSSKDMISYRFPFQTDAFVLDDKVQTGGGSNFFPILQMGKMRFREASAPQIHTTSNNRAFSLCNGTGLFPLFLRITNSKCFYRADCKGDIC